MLHRLTAWDRAVLNAEFNVLIVIAEAASEYGQTADVLGTVWDCHAEVDAVAVIQMKLVNRHIGNTGVVDEDAVVVDDESFEQSVLVPVDKPPVRGEKSLRIGEIARAGPDADKGVIQIKMNVGRPDFIASRCLGRELCGDRNLVNFIIKRNDARNLILHISFGKPEDIRFKMLLMSKVSGIIDGTDDSRRSRNTAGRIDLIRGILTGAQTRFVLIDRWKRAVELKQNFIQMRLTKLLVAVKARVRIDADQIRGFQLADVIRQSPVGNIELFSQLIHAHFSITEKQVQNLDTDIGAKSLKDLKTFGKGFYVAHNIVSLSLLRVKFR